MIDGIKKWQRHALSTQNDFVMNINEVNRSSVVFAVSPMPKFYYGWIDDEQHNSEQPRLIIIPGHYHGHFSFTVGLKLTIGIDFHNLICLSVKSQMCISKIAICGFLHKFSLKVAC